MKKLFLAMLIGAVALVSCSKDDSGNDNGDPLVTNVTLPAAGTSFASGETVTITGNGFTASDAILFRIPTKATAPTTDIRATIVEVTATKLTFKVPDGLPAGENSVILKRGDSEMVLGKISIDAEEPTPGPEPQTTVLYGVGVKGNRSVVYRIDKENGSLTEIAALQDGEYLSGAVTIPGSGIIFGIAREKAWGAGAVCRFDPETKTYEVLTETIPDIEMLGVTEDKLYALCVGTSAVAADTEISLSEIDPQTGAINKVSFGKFLPANTQSIGWSDYGTLVYDPQSNRLLATPYIYDGTDEDFHLLAFDMATQKAVLGERLATDNVNYLFRKGNDICAVYERVVNYGTANESAVTDLYTVDPVGLKLGNKLGGDIADSWFGWNYDATADLMYGLTEKDWETQTYSVGIYDWKAGSFKKLSENVQVQSIVLVE